MSTLQTLDRGLQALEIISEHPAGLSITDLATRLDVHRTIVYRLVTTLEARGLVARAADGRIHLGGGIVVLASRLEPHLQAAARPALEALAEATGATAFISVARGEEAVAILVAEPDRPLLRVGYRVGSRHPLTRGAAGIAILAGRPEAPDDAEAVRRCRRDGFSITRGELQVGAVGVASPLGGAGRASGGLAACVGVVALDDLDTDRAARMVLRTTENLASLVRR